MNKHYYVERKTAHFTYILHFDIKHSRNGYTSAHLYVGDPKDPCLSISVPLLGALRNNRYDPSDISIAHVNKIKDMKECILSGHESKESFPKELLHDAMHILRMNYDHIHHISLTDSSFIPCKVDDTLDLLYYYAGLYEKTWYEANFNAYFVPRDKFIEYKCMLHDYSKKETKPAWDVFMKSVYGSFNMFAKTVFNENEAIIHDMYETAETYPLFFQGLSKLVPKEDKCQFFKGWFEQFMESFVVIPRNWHIDLYTIKAKPMRSGGTRKRRRKQV